MWKSKVLVYDESSDDDDDDDVMIITVNLCCYIHAVLSA